MPEPTELNETLKGRKILSIEPGATSGWMLINLELNSEERDAQPGMRLFLTVFIGGRKGSAEAEHYSTSALHYKVADEFSTVHMIRDGRDPEMPMSSASQALGDTRLAPESEPSTLEDLKSEERALIEPEQAAAKAALLAECEKLASAGVTLVAVHFDGSGDDGVIEDVKCYDSEDYDYARKPMEHDASHVQDHFDALVPPGFEINSGGFGDVVLDVKARKIRVKHTERIEDYATTAYEL